VSDRTEPAAPGRAGSVSEQESGEGLAVEVRGLVKSFGATTALAGVDLAVRRGCVMALLGPNGAGKTTVVRILATLTRPDAGRVAVAGHDVVGSRREVRRRISLTGQYAAIDPGQTAVENLVMVARLRGASRRQARARASEQLDRFDLAEAGSRLVRTYSGGMLRRLDLAVGLLGTPEVVFLDEPTTGLDPRSRQQVWSLVAELAQGGTTVLLTTQYLEEADQLAEQVALMDAGRVVASGTVAELKARIGRHRLVLELADPREHARAALRLGDRLVSSDPQALTVSLATDGTAPAVRALLDELDPSRTGVLTFQILEVSLDDVFLALTGQRGPAERADRLPAVAHV